MTQEVVVPSHCTLIGWVVRDVQGLDIHMERPAVDDSQPGYFDQETYAWTFESVFDHEKASGISLMHASPIFLGPCVDMRPQPEVEWHTFGDIHIAECDGVTLVATQSDRGYCCSLRRNRKWYDGDTHFTDLDAAKSYCVRRARELSKGK